MSNPIGKYEYADGSVFVWTHKGENGRQIAESMKPYIGRKVLAGIFNGRNRWHDKKAALLDIRDDEVKLDLYDGEPRWFDAYEVFGGGGKGTKVFPV